VYVGIIHVLLHRLVWGVGNKIRCLLWQLGEWQVWSLTVLHRHALYGDYRVDELSSNGLIDGEPEYGRWNRRL